MPFEGAVCSNGAILYPVQTVRHTGECSLRKSLASLDGHDFDVAVIGAGVIGASAAQHLAAAGYDVLLVDEGDFASGSSSRSTRLQHCGLRYLAPGKSMAEFFLHPSRLATALRMARQAMQSRAQFVRTTPERVRAMTVGFPIWRGGRYSPWQVNLAFRLLEKLGPKDVPLDYRRLRPAEAAADPLLRKLRDHERLIEVAQFREYEFEWPERIAVDAVLDAARMGATVRNYTRCVGLAREGEGWRVRLQDARAPAEQAEIGAKMLVNAAGIWIDRVNAQAGGGARRKITGTKGVHIMVRLPPECRDRGIATLNRLDEGLYCVPWRGIHYFGPTETLYEGDIDDIQPEEEEIRFLLDEANHLLPSLRLTRQDVLFAWAGVRPLTYNPDLPMGNRSRELHDLGREGMPGALAMTAGPVMTHRGAGQEIAAAVRRRLAPSRAPQPLSYAARRFPENQNSPPLLDDYTDIKLADLRHAAANEQVTDLVDLLFRRVGAGWTAGMAAAEAERAAEAVADIMDWDAAERQAQVQRYHAYLARRHARRTA